MRTDDERYTRDLAPGLMSSLRSAARSPQLQLVRVEALFEKLGSGPWPR